MWKMAGNSLIFTRGQAGHAMQCYQPGSSLPFPGGADCHHNGSRICTYLQSLFVDTCSMWSSKKHSSEASALAQYIVSGAE